MKKILVNGYFGMNLGDDLFFKILFERYSEVEFVFYTNSYFKKFYNNYKKNFENYNNVKVKKYNDLRKYLSLINFLPIMNKIQFSKYDATVFIGGSIFMEASNSGRNGKDKNSIIKYFYNNNKEIFILGSNFGPYVNKEFKEKYNEIFRICTDVCFREKYSYDLFSNLESVRVAPDIVFNLKDKEIEKKKGSIGISIIELSNRKELRQYSEVFEEKICEIIVKCINKNKRITLFSFSRAEGDMIAINRIISKLDEEYRDRVKICDYDGNLNEFLIEFQSQENIIGCRFHSVILSQVYNQGVYPLIYSDKTYNVLKDIGLDKNYKYIKDITELDVSQVVNCIDNNKINDKSIFEQAEKQFKGFDTYVGYSKK